MPIIMLPSNDCFLSVVLPAPNDPSIIFGANLIAWWDAADGLAGGTSATDRTGNGNNLAATGNTAITNTGFNGFPGYSFQTSALGGLQRSTFPSLGANGAIFMALTITNGTQNFSRVLSGAPSGSANDFSLQTALFVDIETAGPNLNAGINSGLTNKPSITYGSYYRVVIAWDSGHCYTYFNNSIADVGGDSTGGTVNIGGGSPFILSFGFPFNGASNNSLLGIIADMFVVNVTPSTQQLNSADSFFRSRFGI